MVTSELRLEEAVVVSQEEVCQDTYLLWLSCPPLAKGAAPGRFVMLLCGEGFDPLLPRPMSYHRFRQVGGETQWAILYDVRGRGTRWLSQRRPGDHIWAFGPLGRGFAPERGATNLLLIAGGLGIAPIIALADAALAQGRTVTLLYGAKTASKLLPPSYFPTDLEIVFATEDGSHGHHGLVTDLVPSFLPWAHQAFVCGPTGMYRELANVLRGVSSTAKVQVLMEEHMACGTGICYGCTTFTRKGPRLVCRDGPCFALEDLY